MNTNVEEVPATLGILSIISFVGSIGNLFVILIYVKRCDKVTSNLFMTILAASDTFTCTFVIPSTMYMEFKLWEISSRLFCKTYMFFNNSLIPFSALLISLIAIDRYFCICHPFLQAMNLKRSKVFICIVLWLSILLGILASFQVHIEIIARNSSDSDGRTIFVNISRCVEAYVWRNRSFAQKMFYEVTKKSQLVSYSICILIVIGLYSKIYFTVLKVRRKKDKLKGLNTQKHRHCLGKSAAPVQIRFEKNTQPYCCENNNNNNREFDDQNIQLHSQCSPEFVLVAEDEEMQEQRVVMVPSSTAAEVNDRAPLTEGVALNVTSNTCQQYPSSSLAPPLRHHHNQQQQFNTNNNNNPSLHTHPPTLQTPPSYSSLNSVNVNSNNVANKKTSKSMRETKFVQNLKLAAMLFVVAITYIITFLPANLMANDIITLYLPIFYLYYVNNAVNPIIYCFMNRNFRNELKSLPILRPFIRRSK